MECLITSPQKTRRYKHLKRVSLPAFSGRMQILPRHAEAFVLLKRGDIVLGRNGDPNREITITGGACHIKDDRVVVIL